jgi:hypothetical protein
MKKLIFLLVTLAPGLVHAALPPALIGDWAITTPMQEAAWLSVRDTAAGPDVRVMWAVGGIRQLKDAGFKGDLMTVRLRRRKQTVDGSPSFIEERLRVKAVADRLSGEFVEAGDNGETVSRFYGRRLPPMPARPDLGKVRFGEAVPLFNGRDLSGWRTWRPEKKNGWSVKDGLLINETPKTDFSAYGDYANLMTTREFGDFQLRIEFRVPPGGNSGIYLRGLYEVQVLDRDSRMQGISGVGSVFARVKATTNAGKPGGEWNRYDITLVDRHVTVVLNGVKVIDNEPVEGPTGGALRSDVTLPGPIYLQGDHTSVAYRNIRLRPRL